LITVPAALMASEMMSGGAAAETVTTAPLRRQAEGGATNPPSIGSTVGDRVEQALDRASDQFQVNRARVQAAVDAVIARAEEIVPDYERIRRRAETALDTADDRLAELLAAVRARRR
jgi:hypothetical protein